MKRSRNSSIDQLQMAGRYESVRTILLSDSCRDRLDKPLAYWALPTDRRLPLAFLGRTLEDLLDTPFDELASTPGIGRKKINSFVGLLSRAADTDPADLPATTAGQRNGKQSHQVEEKSTNGFDPSTVSEVVWARWRASVLEHGLEHEAIGRFAPSLKDVTRVIWNTPLSEYTGLKLQEIRESKTHGEKRVRAVLEVFYSVHNLVGGISPQARLAVRIVPRLIDSVETWIGRALQTPGVPDEEEIFSGFTRPLLEQIEIDASSQIVRLTEERIGLHGPVSSIRQAARSTGLTRARVYQLLNEVNDIVTVRWPLGRHQVYELRERFRAELEESGGSVDLSQFLAAVEVFYPANRRGAAGPLETAGELASA